MLGYKPSGAIYKLMKLGKFVNILKHQFLPLKNGNNNSPQLIELREFNEIKHVTRFTQWMVHRKSPIKIGNY